MNIPAFSPRALTLAMLTLALGACGGGGGGSSAPASSTISGTASKGTLKNALVTAYKVTAAGQKGDKLGETRTDAKGVYSLTVTGYTGPVLLEMTTDAASKMTCDIPAGCGGGKAFGDDVDVTMTLSTVLPDVQPGTIKSAITPFTHLAAQRALLAGLTKAEIEKDLTQVAAIFNLPDLNNTQPADVTAAATAAAPIDAQRYALLNAAIGQLAGSPGAVNAKLGELLAQLQAHNGQLVNMSTGGATIDLEDVLNAAKAVAASTEASDHLGDLLKTVVQEDLQTAVTAGNTVTDASGTPQAGADDIAKAKAFAQSAHDLAASLRSVDTNFVTQLQTKYAPVADILDNAQTGDEMSKLPSALQAALTVASAAIDDKLKSAAPRTPQQMLDAGFNPGAGTPYGLSSTATAGTLAVTVTGNVATVNGTVTIAQVMNTMMWNGAAFVMQSTPVGAPQTFTLTNLKLAYPDPAASQATYAVTLMKGSALAGTKTRLSLGADSGLTIKYASAASLASRIAALGAVTGMPADGLLPDSVSVNLSQATFGLAGTTANFVGNLGWSMNRVKLPITADATTTRTFVLPAQMSMAGTFTGLGGDSVSASLTLGLDKTSNPRLAPDNGYVRQNVFSYQYNGTDTATLTVNTALPLEDSWMPAVNRYDFQLMPGGCGGSNLLFYPSTDYFGQPFTAYVSCTEQSTVPAALQEAAAQNDGTVSAWVAGEGEYVPALPTNFNFATQTAVSLPGQLIAASGGPREDATHFATGSLSLQLAANVSVGGVTQNMQIRLDAARNAFQGGTGTLTLTANGKTIKVSAPVTGGKAAYTISDGNNVSVDVALGADNRSLALTLNGKQLGTLYTLNGLPVARFVDNSLMAL